MSGKSARAAPRHDERRTWTIHTTSQSPHTTLRASKSTTPSRTTQIATYKSQPLQEDLPGHIDASRPNRTNWMRRISCIWARIDPDTIREDGATRVARARHFRNAALTHIFISRSNTIHLMDYSYKYFLYLLFHSFFTTVPTSV